MSKNTLISLILVSILIGWGSIFAAKAQRERANMPDFLFEEGLKNKLITVQGNSLSSASDHFSPEPKVVRKINVIITAYSSSPLETDGDPFITATGTQVKEGIVANNFLSFGTKIRIPEIYGDQIFVVEDRMNRKKGNYHIDIWFPDRELALDFGTKRTYIEILEG